MPLRVELSLALVCGNAFRSAHVLFQVCGVRFSSRLCCFILHHGWFATVVRSVSVLRSRVLAPEFSPSTLPPDRHSTDSSDLPLPGSCSFFAFATLRCLFSPGLVSSRYLSLKITGYLLEPLLGQPVSICRPWSLQQWRLFHSFYHGWYLYQIQETVINAFLSSPDTA